MKNRKLIKNGLDFSEIMKIIYKKSKNITLKTYLIPAFLMWPIFRKGNLKYRSTSHTVTLLVVL
jgi:hypothetical protein